MVGHQRGRVSLLAVVVVLSCKTATKDDAPAKAGSPQVAETKREPAAPSAAPADEREPTSPSAGAQPATAPVPPPATGTGGAAQDDPQGSTTASPPGTGHGSGGTGGSESGGTGGTGELAPPNARYEARECTECEPRHRGNRCVFMTRPDTPDKSLGCGEVSPSGPYAITIRETGSEDDGSWKLFHTYYGPRGMISDDNVCEESMSIDCPNLPSFIAVGNGGWTQDMGVSGAGDNDQFLHDLESETTIELPIGEYEVVGDPTGEWAGFFARTPNNGDFDDGVTWQVTLGCVNMRTHKVHTVWRKKFRGNGFDAYSGAEAGWRDGLLTVERGKVLRRMKCPKGGKKAASPTP